MEIKVYADASKSKTKVIGGLTLRQLLGFLGLILISIFMVANTFLLHIPEAIVQPFCAFGIIGILALTLFKIKGMFFERWLKLKLNFYLSQKIRTYRTERIEEFNKDEFKKDPKINEADF